MDDKFSEKPSQKPMSTTTKNDLVKQEERQAGDLSLWTYYAKSIGRWHIMLQAIFTAAWVLGSNFPRK
jgi:hypothetical protein